MRYTHYDEDDQKVIWEIGYRPGYRVPEKTSGHPDTWHEAEEDSTEVESVVDEAGNEIIFTLDKKTLELIADACDKYDEDQHDY